MVYFPENESSDLNRIRNTVFAVRIHVSGIIISCIVKAVYQSLTQKDHIKYIYSSIEINISLDDIFLFRRKNNVICRISVSAVCTESYCTIPAKIWILHLQNMVRQL